MCNYILFTTPPKTVSNFCVFLPMIKAKVKLMCKPFSLQCKLVRLQLLRFVIVKRIDRRRALR